MRAAVVLLLAAGLALASPLASAQLVWVPEPPAWLLILIVMTLVAHGSACVDAEVEHYTAGGPECWLVEPLPLP